MNLDIAGHVAVVTGGANGIGLAIARALSAEGARVAILDIHEGSGAAAASLGGEAQAAAIRCDIANEDSVREAAAGVRDRLGRTNHVVHAAGIGSGKFGYPFLNLHPSDWERVLRVNLLGAVHVAHAFAPAMVEARSGDFVFIASVAGQIGSQTDPPYSASKAGLINFAQCMAKDLAPHGVRVNTICPGMVKTAVNRSVWESWNALQPPEKKRDYDDWAGEKVRQVVPLGRWQDPEDVAAMAAFLASPKAKNITGQTINVDGGYVMHW